MEKLKKIVIGLLAGIICGLFASGGGLILVPAFIYLLKVEDKLARGTTTVCILVMVIVSSLFYYSNNNINLKLALFCALGGIIGGIIGSKLLKKIPTIYIKIVFVIFLFYVSIKMLM